jgi:hypothetical protein
LHTYLVTRSERPDPKEKYNLPGANHIRKEEAKKLAIRKQLY